MAGRGRAGPGMAWQGWARRGKDASKRCTTRMIRIGYDPMTHTNPTRSLRVTVLLSPDELAIADELARAQGVSRSDVLRQPLYAQRPLVGIATKRATPVPSVSRS